MEIGGKYRPLWGYLQRAGANQVALTFQEVEIILGESLPYSAHTYREWWANENVQTTMHTHCLAWQAAGFSATPDLAAESVVFKKV